MEQIFAIYRGEKFIDTGTAKELAAKLNVQPRFIRYLSTPAHQRRLARSKNPSGDALLAIKLGPDDDDALYSLEEQQQANGGRA